MIGLILVLCSPCVCAADRAIVYDLDECTSIERVGICSQEAYDSLRCWPDEDDLPPECWPTAEDRNPCDL